MDKRFFDPKGVVRFIKELDLLKDATRTAWTRRGRRESVAEHSWRLAMFALALQDQLVGMDSAKILKLCLVHDLGEAYEGDVPAIEEEDQAAKLAREEKAVLRLLEPLDRETQNAMLSLWWEYNKGKTEEARFVKALDKLETIVQHNQGQNPPGFNYEFNLAYGRELAMHNVITTQLRQIIDSDTQGKLSEEP